MRGLLAFVPCRCLMVPPRAAARENPSCDGSPAVNVRSRRSTAHTRQPVRNSAGDQPGPGGNADQANARTCTPHATRNVRELCNCVRGGARRRGMFDLTSRPEGQSPYAAPDLPRSRAASTGGPGTPLHTKATSPSPWAPSRDRGYCDEKTNFEGATEPRLLSHLLRAWGDKNPSQLRGYLMEVDPSETAEADDHEETRHAPSSQQEDVACSTSRHTK